MKTILIDPPAIDLVLCNLLHRCVLSFLYYPHSRRTSTENSPVPMADRDRYRIRFVRFWLPHCYVFTGRLERNTIKPTP